MTLNDSMTMTLKDVQFNIRGEMDEQEDVLRCLRTLVMTPEGTVPLDREFGINNAILGYPIDVAQNLLAVELINKVDRYEPRATVLEVELSTDDSGQLIAKVVISGG